MRKETINKIEQEINEKTTLPNNLKETIKKEVFTNIIIAIAMIIYFTFLITGSVGTVKTVRSIDFNIFSIVLLTVSIYLFEIAYKKDNGKLAIYGIETLIASIITLFFPYIIFELDEFYKKYYMIVSAYIGIYYIIKSICIAQRAKKLHIKQSSDIKEIVKKEKRKTKIKEEVEDIKTTKEERKEHKETSKEETVEINNEDNQNKVATPKIEKTITQKQEDAPKKRGRPKKSVGVAVSSDPQREQTKESEKVNDNNKPKEEKVPKKRGRPKKSDIEKKEKTEPKKEQTKKSEKTNNENKQNVGIAPQGDPKPKKRGRPRKVVTAND